MRYGVVRGASFLPPIHEQRSALSPWQCDLIIEEDASLEAVRRVDQFLLRAKPGDEIVVHDLGVFMKRTGKLAQFLRDLLELQASVIVAAPERTLRLEPHEPLISTLTLLAIHESRGPPSAQPRHVEKRDTERRKLLSAHQIRYARKLHAEGESLRAIGLLFQISPREVSELLTR